MRYDVIVVGAGPAGSSAARVAAERGLSTVLLDKAEFPRDKPCGGGVNVRTTRLLPFPIDPVVERTIHGMSVSFRYTPAFTRYATEPLCFMTQRSRLDAYLVERASAAGAIFREGASIRDVERQDAHVVVRAGAELFEGRTLVAADGVNGRTARLAGVEIPRWMAVALEGNLPVPTSRFRIWENLLSLDLGSIPSGYGWLFPKGDHLNLGVGGWKHIGPTLRRELERLTRSLALDPADITGLRGYQLPIRRPEAPLVDGNLVVVGDAAGLLDPFTGEGIYAAVWSGTTAAAVIAAYLAGRTPDLRNYQRAVERELLPELRLAHQMKDLMYLWPGFYVGVTRRVTLAWRILCGLMRGDLTYVQLRRRLWPLWLGVSANSGLLRARPHLSRAVDVDPLVPRHAQSHL